jgi:hypothetical protein
MKTYIVLIKISEISYDERKACNLIENQIFDSKAKFLEYFNYEYPHLMNLMSIMEISDFMEYWNYSTTDEDDCINVNDTYMSYILIKE